MSNAQRRRMGAPSSTYGAANQGTVAPVVGGVSVMDDVKQALAGMAQQGREPMGTDAVSNVNTSSSFLHPELLRAKYAIQGGDPALVPGVTPK